MISPSGRDTVHEKSDEDVYRVWCTMLARCTNRNSPNWADYGGRGIQVCERWERSFKNFLADMGPRPPGTSFGRRQKRAIYSIDRYPDDCGNYEPGNCRWATQLEQCRNRRGTRLVTHAGKTLCVKDWAKETRMKAATILARLDRGLSPDEVFSQPLATGRESGLIAAANRWKLMRVEKESDLLASDRILGVFFRVGETTPRRAVIELGFESTVVSDKVHRLVKRGLLERVTLTKDSSVYRITPSGKERFEAIAPISQE